MIRTFCLLLLLVLINGNTPAFAQNTRAEGQETASNQNHECGGKKEADKDSCSEDCKKLLDSVELKNGELKKSNKELQKSNEDKNAELKNKQCEVECLKNKICEMQKVGKNPIRVTFGQPNVWSLEDAHYLLNRIRENNRRLQPKPLSADLLDPNKVNSTRLQAAQSLLELGFKYDAAQALKNQVAQDNYQRILESSGQLGKDYTEAVSNLLLVIQQIAAAEDELNRVEERIEAGGTDQDLKRKAELEAYITQKVGEKAANEELVKMEKERLDQLASVDVAGTVPADLSGSLQNLLDGGTLLSDSKTTVKVDASTALDNYINMQYELVAKQLTLLRDEVGPNERLIFLELPQSFTIHHTKKINDRLVEVKWKLARVNDKPDFYDLSKVIASVFSEVFYEEKGDMLNNNDVFCTSQWIKKALDAINDDRLSEYGLGAYALRNQYDYERLNLFLEYLKDSKGLYERVNSNGLLSAPQYLTELVEDGVKESDTVDEECKEIAEENKKLNLENKLLKSKCKGIDVQDSDDQLNILAKYLLTTKGKKALRKRINALAFSPKSSNEYGNGDQVHSDACYMATNKMRTIDVLPRSSSLNISEKKYKSSNRNYSGVFSFLNGIGASFNYAKNKEAFNSYLNQEFYATGFGKGEREFGWVFGPKPGERRINSGVKTTFAIVIVPENTQQLTLTAEAKSYRLKRNIDKDNIEPMKTKGNFVLDLPGFRPGFWVQEADYTTVKPGKRVTITLRGEGFSPQLGILVNGRALEQVTSISDYFQQNRFSYANTHPGYFEYLNKSNLIMTFQLPETVKSVPTITLVSPTRTEDINDFGIFSDKNLYEIDPPPKLIQQVKFSDQSVHITGSGFKAADQLAINGYKIGVKTDDTRIGFFFPLNCENKFLNDASWDLVLFNKGKPITGKTIPNPLWPVIDDYIYHLPFDGDSPDMLVEVRGSGLDQIDIKHVESTGNNPKIESQLSDSLLISISEFKDPTVLLMTPKIKSPDGTLCASGRPLVLTHPRVPVLKEQVKAVFPIEKAAMLELHGKHMGRVVSAKIDGKATVDGVNILVEAFDDRVILTIPAKKAAAADLSLELITNVVANGSPVSFSQSNAISFVAPKSVTKKVEKKVKSTETVSQ